MSGRQEDARQLGGSAGPAAPQPSATQRGTTWARARGDTWGHFCGRAPVRHDHKARPIAVRMPGVCEERPPAAPPHGSELHVAPDLRRRAGCEKRHAPRGMHVLAARRRAVCGGGVAAAVCFGSRGRKGTLFFLDLCHEQLLEDVTIARYRYQFCTG